MLLHRLPSGVLKIPVVATLGLDFSLPKWFDKTKIRFGRYWLTCKFCWLALNSSAILDLRSFNSSSSETFPLHQYEFTSHMNWRFTFACWSPWTFSRLASASFMASLAAVAFFTNASFSLIAMSISACLVLIFAVQGWSSPCFTSIWSWKVCVLSTYFDQR